MTCVWSLNRVLGRDWDYSSSSPSWAKLLDARPMGRAAARHAGPSSAARRNSAPPRTRHTDTKPLPTWETGCHTSGQLPLNITRQSPERQGVAGLTLFDAGAYSAASRKHSSRYVARADLSTIPSLQAQPISVRLRDKVENKHMICPGRKRDEGGMMTRDSTRTVVFQLPGSV